MDLWKMAILAGVVATAAGLGCNADKTNPWRVDPGTDASDTVGPQGDTWSGDSGDTSDTSEPGPVETTFRLVNDGKYPVSVVPIDVCTSSNNQWLRLHSGGERLDLQDSCGICNCEDLDDGTCAVCGAPKCTEFNPRRRVDPGNEYEWTWSGRHFERGSRGDQSCERPVTPDRGQRLRAKICWRPRNPRAGSGFGTQCETVEFRYGQDPVVHRVTPGGERTPRETTFRLKNESDAPIFTVREHWDGCFSGDVRPRRSWFELRDGDGPIGVGDDCRECSCASVRSGTCSACSGRECPGPLRETNRVEPGDSETLTWDGLKAVPKTVDGTQCGKETIPPVGHEMDVEFCWRDGPGRTSKPTCETVTFEYGRETEVVHEVGTKGPKPPVETTFVVRNRSGRSTTLEGTGSCYPDSPAWIEVRNDGSKIDVGLNCTDCRCERLRNGHSCPGACPAVCRGFGSVAVGPGSEESWTWSGHVAEESKVNGKQCLEETTPSIGETLRAVFCWEGGTVCTSTTFEYGKDTRVAHTVR